MTHPELTAKLAHEKWVRDKQSNVAFRVLMGRLTWAIPDLNQPLDYERNFTKN